jgi:hypothetical protein
MMLASRSVVPVDHSTADRRDDAGGFIICDR